MKKAVELQLIAVVLKGETGSDEGGESYLHNFPHFQRYQTVEQSVGVMI